MSKFAKKTKKENNKRKYPRAILPKELRKDNKNE